ncbi:hypothetical protein RRF57_011756 [Xylaria bambusicola]|uniref:Uncharacterized protein n=1 Tax=Xylaria bambusicola TaxID=326684 RepID=A0AAN7V332_9PEZI
MDNASTLRHTQIDLIDMGGNSRVAPVGSSTKKSERADSPPPKKLVKRSLLTKDNIKWHEKRPKIETSTPALRRQ